MSRDSFKPIDPRKLRQRISPLLDEVDAPRLPYEAPGNAGDTGDAARAARARARRARHVANPSETSPLELGADLGRMVGVDVDEEALEDAIMQSPTARNILAPAVQRYNPNALGGAYVDALTLGNSAELMALTEAAQGEDYEDQLAASEAALAREYSRSPGSAIAGGAAGIVNQAAVPMRLPALAGASRGMNLLRAIGPLAGAGAALGGVGGAIAADEGEALEGAARGALRGGATGAAGAALGAGAEALRAAELAPLTRLASIPVRGALAGAEYGVLGTPGAHPDATPDDYLREAGHGAVIGGIAEPVLAAVGQGVRLLGRRRPSARGVVPEGPNDIDESVLLMDESPDAPPLPDAPDTSPVLTPQEAVARARAASPSGLEDMARSTIESDPAHERLFSLTATGPGMRAASRSGVAGFGSVRGLIDELQNIGIAREHSVYGRRAERARALAAGDEIVNQIRRTHARVGAAGGTVDAHAIADDIEAAAAAFEAQAPENADHIAAANEMRGYAERMRGPRDRFFDVFEPDGGDMPEVLDVEELAPRPLDYAGIRSRMSAEWNAGRSGRQSNVATGSQTPQQRVAPMIYRALRPYRELLAQRALSPADYAAHQANQRASLAINAIAPHDMRLDINESAQPANLRGALARVGAMAGNEAAGGGVVGGVASGTAAWLREQILAEYQHSLRAAANELRLAAPVHSATADALPRATGLLTGAEVGREHEAADVDRARMADEEANLAPVDIDGAGDLGTMTGTTPELEDEEDPNDDLRTLTGAGGTR